MSKSDYSITVVKKRKRDFTTKILLPTMVTILLFILTIFLIIIPHFRVSIMDEKRVMIKELTNTAISVLEEFESREKLGLMSRSEAQKQAVEQILHLRYGGEHKDYFWISDLHPNMVMHPYRSDLQGKSLEQFSDSHGKKLFLDFVQVVKEHGEGYVDYMWQWQDDSQHIVPKLSYVKGFEPWGWIVGTGIYVEDVKKNIRSLTHNLILISLAISLVMVLLLSVIMQQTIKIEEARLAAEKDLLESMEKYRTLVQAATEGLLMVLDNRITFVNDRVTQLLGFSANDLIDQKPSFLLPENQDNSTSILHGELPEEGQYELVLRNNQHEQREMLVTISPFAISERNGTILILKDVTTKEPLHLSTDDYKGLISSFGLAQLRLVLDSKGKIVELDEKSRTLLGYDSADELKGLPVLALFAGRGLGRKFHRMLLADGRINEAELALKRKNGDELKVALSLVAVAGEAGQVICEGIVEDVTRKLFLQQETDRLITDIKLSGMFLEQPVSRFIGKLCTANMHETVASAETTMISKNCEIISVTGDNNELLGVVTFADIRKRVLLNKLAPQTPLYQIMTAPVNTINIDTLLNEALMLAAKQQVKHLLVRDKQNNLVGILRLSDLTAAFCHSKQTIEQRIDNISSLEELQNYFQQIITIARPLILQQIQPATIGSLIASVSFRITDKIINLGIKELGEPPVPFTFIVLGSEGRQEQTLETDQDNAIIYQDVAAEQAAEVQGYFLRLATIICDALHNAGFSHCRGNVMAKNPRWCAPLSTWKKYVSSWVDVPDPQNILDVSIFFDFRPMYGDFALAEELRRHINRTVGDKPLFFYNFAENVLGFKSAVKITGSIATEKKDGQELFDLKYAVTPIVMFARIFALYHQLETNNTVERLKLLCREGVLSERELREVLFGYSQLMGLRYRNQVDLLEKGLSAGNLIDIRELSETEISLIKKIFSFITRLQSLLAQQFKKSQAG